MPADATSLLVSATMTPPAPTTIVLLVAHPKRQAVLTAAEAGLPTADVDGQPTVRLAEAAFESTIGPVGPILRFSTHGGPDDDHPDRAILELETVGAKAPAGHRWTRFDDLDVDGLEPTLRKPVRRWIRRQLDGPAPLDPPWSRSGWFARASGWMVATMTDLGAPPTAPPRVSYMWALSAVLRAPSAYGSFFLKCSPPMFRTEAAVTAALARVTPELVTPVAAIEPDEGWLLMRDLGEAMLGDRPPADWGSGLTVHAAIQQAWSSRVHELRGLGLPVRPLAALAAAVPTLLESRREAMTPNDQAAWDRAIPDLQRACLRLDELGPPPTLVHGDLHPWNVAMPGGRPTVFDWTDASVSHPFVDLAAYIGRGRSADDRRAILAAYLDAWADRVPAHTLREAGELAMVVGCLYQVVSYRAILSGMDPDDAPELHGADLGYARGAVAALHEGIEAQTSAPIV